MHVVVERCKPVYIVPDSFVVGMKNMRTVGMQVNALGKGAVNIAAGMCSLINNQAAKPALQCLMGKYGTKKACAYNEVIVWWLMVRRHKL